MSPGTVDIRKTHLALWRLAMGFAILNVALGLNFIFLSPTFPIFEQSYYLWGGIFLGLGVAKVAFLNLWRNLHMVRRTMGAEVFYMLVLSLGTLQPWWTGQGSLQLPILYLGLAALEMPLILEPYTKNPWVGLTRSGQDGR